MKILHVITLSTLGGAQSVVINLSNEQIKHHEVFIISSEEGTAWNLLDGRINVIKIKEIKRKIGLLDIIVLLKLFYYRFKINPDVIHLHSSKMGVLGRIAFPSSRIIYTVHGFDSIRLAHRCFLFPERILQFFCKFIVGVSQYDKKMLNMEGIKHNVRMIYNGLFDPISVQYDLDDSFILKIKEIKQKYKKTIFCIARDTPPKKDELFFSIAEQNPDYAFIWIGNSNPHTNTNNLFWAGLKEKAFMYLPYCDLFLLPSNFEGLPMSIIEAMAFSKPIVASNVGGISELLDGTNGFAVENTVDAFSEKINQLLGDEIKLKKAGDISRHKYIANFNLEQMIDNYNKLYLEICHK